jgi:hypothetical protein
MDIIKIEKYNEVYIKIYTEISILMELSTFFTFDVPGAKFSPITETEISDHIENNFHNAVGKAGDNLRSISLGSQARLMKTLPSDVINKYDLDNPSHVRPLDQGEMPYFRHLRNHIMDGISGKEKARREKNGEGYRKHKIAVTAGMAEMEHHFGKAIASLVAHKEDSAAKEVLDRMTTNGAYTKEREMKNWIDRVRSTPK